MKLRKRLNNKKKKQRLSLWDIGKLVTPGLLVTVARLKNAQKPTQSPYTNTIHATIRKIIPKEIPKRPIQCYTCTECNSTFYHMHKLLKHSRE